MTERWEPKDLDALRSFVENGDASETRFYEFKERLPSNKAVAKELAGFAIDGGSLVIGVAEPESGKFDVKPVEHAGLREKVEQIAQSRVDPPLLVESRVLKDPNNDALGVLWVTVPPSPEAPHQVGGVYYERGDTETRPMSDGAVARLMAARRKSIEEVRSKLENLMENDPIPNGKTAHVFGIAEPIGAGPEELYEAIGGDDGWFGFCEGARRSIEEYPLVPRQSSHGANRPWYLLCQPGGVVGPNGYTVRSSANAETGDDDYVLRLSFGEDGTITYFNNVGSVAPRDGQGNNAPYEYVIDAKVVVGSCLDVLDAALAVARRTGQRRSWDIGFGLTGTQGLREQGDWLRRGRQPFAASNYEQVARVSHQQLDADTWGVARKLTRRFATGLGVDFDGVAKRMGYVEAEDTTQGQTGAG